MSAFSEIVSAQRAPGRTIKAEPWVFADEWPDKPNEPVCFGIRLMSESDKSKARAVAEELADALHEDGRHARNPEKLGNWVDAYNDALIRQVAALGVCDPNDVTTVHGLLPYAEDQVRVALTSAGARWLFDQIEQYEIEISSVDPLLETGEVEELCARLDAQFDELSNSDRKLLAHVLARLRDRGAEYIPA